MLSNSCVSKCSVSKYSGRYPFLIPAWGHPLWKDNRGHCLLVMDDAWLSNHPGLNLISHFYLGEEKLSCGSWSMYSLASPCKAGLERSSGWLRSVPFRHVGICLVASDGQKAVIMTISTFQMYENYEEEWFFIPLSIGDSETLFNVFDHDSISSPLLIRFHQYANFISKFLIYCDIRIS